VIKEKEYYPSAALEGTKGEIKSPKGSISEPIGWKKENSVAKKDCAPASGEEEKVKGLPQTRKRRTS